MPGLPPPDILIPLAIVIFFAIGIHEYAHCKFADMAGDPTPRLFGRVSLNLTKHFELVGTLMMLFTMTTGFGIGWGKPAPMDPQKMNNPRWDFFIAVIAGPTSNILQAAIYAFLFRGFFSTNPSLLFFGEELTFLGTLLFMGVQLNIAMAVFNMIPLGPLDGHWLVGLLMPEKPRYYWFRWNRQFGYYALIALVLLSQFAREINPDFDVFGRLIRPATRAITDYFLGPVFQ